MVPASTALAFYATLALAAVLLAAALSRGRLGTPLVGGALACLAAALPFVAVRVEGARETIVLQPQGWLLVAAAIALALVALALAWSARGAA